MDKEKRKALIDEYKNREIEWFIVELKNKVTGISFLEVSKNPEATYNSLSLQLDTSNHPNKELLNMWKKYGKDSFIFSILEKMKTEDKAKDYTEETKKRREELLKENENYRKVWH